MKILRTKSKFQEARFTWTQASHIQQPTCRSRKVRVLNHTMNHSSGTTLHTWRAELAYLDVNPPLRMRDVQCSTWSLLPIMFPPQPSITASDVYQTARNHGLGHNLELLLWPGLHWILAELGRYKHLFPIGRSNYVGSVIKTQSFRSHTEVPQHRSRLQSEKSGCRTTSTNWGCREGEFSARKSQNNDL